MPRPIDADALKISFCTNTKYGEYCECTDGSEVRFTSREVDKIIDNAPTIETERHGEWIEVYMSGPSSFVGTCSICKATNDIPPPERANYCPSCGARMDGGKSV